ncbi:uncharacterized protein SAPINGB_P006355 [Magnusiomyces paraingens]|uniref:Vps72/YL1 C-terminal domain-containing protein n=1 Tax=Magnusiomyces paraingens TaxID=2606893 RepID=A0A5E8C6P0_9ASCO|nr:uncharacterized protein SAPINGB_P006355 [Saprochaete ingens]VVT58730.1 unnamed protein product [Saprochaete ingens]
MAEPKTIAELDFNVVPRTFKVPTWKTPSRRNKPARTVIADEQRRLQALATAETAAATAAAEAATEAAAASESDGTATAPSTAPKFHASYAAVDAPPSVRPRKWWCDITGLEGRYRSVRNGLRYHNAEIYGIVQGMAPGVDQQYLELRNANVVLK